MVKIPTDIEKYGSKYNESELKKKLIGVAKKAGEKVVYAVLVAYYALQSDTLSFKDKARLYGALGYFILPADFIPDSLPLLGYSDDLAALMFVIHAIGNNITPEVKSKAKEKLKEWFGDASNFGEETT